VKKVDSSKKNTKKTVKKITQTSKTAPQKKKTAPVKRTEAKKNTAVKINIKKTPVKKTIKPAVKQKFPEKKEESIKKNTEKPVILPKSSPVQNLNHSLPEGSEIQVTGQRRPLIVFPK